MGDNGGGTRPPPPPGATHAGVTQPTFGATASVLTGAVEGWGKHAKGRRGRPHGSGRGLRAARTGRGAAAKPRANPSIRGGGGEESGFQTLVDGCYGQGLTFPFFWRSHLPFTREGLNLGRVPR